MGLIEQVKGVGNWIIRLIKAITEHVIKAEYKTDTGKANSLVLIFGFILVLIGKIETLYWAIGACVSLICCATTRTVYIETKMKKYR